MLPERAGKYVRLSLTHRDSAVEQFFNLVLPSLTKSIQGIRYAVVGVVRAPVSRFPKALKKAINGVDLFRRAFDAHPRIPGDHTDIESLFQCG